jgi:predicted RNase H-like nuclease
MNPLNPRAGQSDEGSGLPPCRVGGLDGCRGGWVLASGCVDQGAPTTVEVISGFAEVLARMQIGSLAAVVVDIPIGLPATGSRLCDVEARRRLGLRRSSVFPAPLRALLEAVTWDEALAMSRRLAGRGISKQAYGIFAKVREVDRLITPALQDRLVEAHPELSLASLTGAPMAHPKRTPDGHAERLAALAGSFPDIGKHTTRRLQGAAPDDVLDAYALLWTARRWMRGEAVVLGGGRDKRGLRMEIAS